MALQAHDQVSLKRSKVIEILLRRRQLAVGVALVVIVVAVGVLLGHPHHSGSSRNAPASSAPVADGLVSGAVQACGGVGDVCRAMSVGICTPRCLTTRYVIAKTTAGATKAKAQLHHGRFVLRLAAGAYQLDLFATGRDERRALIATKRVSVVRGATRTVAFRFGIR